MTDWSPLVTQGILSSLQLSQLESGYEILLQLRAQCHLFAQRRVDQLTFELQEGIAKKIHAQLVVAGESSRHAVAPAVETMMARFYQTAREITAIVGQLLDAARWAHKPQRVHRLDAAFGLYHQELALLDSQWFQQRPRDVLRMFKVAAQESVPVRAQTLDLVRQQIDGLALQSDDKACEMFWDVLTDHRDKSRPSLLEQMNESGVISQMIDGWRACVCRVQHDLYHVFTVDQHQLYAVLLLKRIASGELAESWPLATEVFRRYAKRPEGVRALYLALLLHDVGKPLGKGHAEKGAVIAEAAAKQLGLPESEARDVAFLVRQHLTMSKLSQRRDVSDPNTVSRLANKMGTADRLDALFLLSLCDAEMTSPGNLSGWKRGLMEELYRETSRVLAGGSVSPQHEKARAARERLRLYAEQEQADPQAIALSAAISASLLSHLDARQSVAAFDSALEALRSGQTYLHVVERPGGFTEVYVATRDVRGLLSLVAGVFAAHQVEVLAAELGHVETHDGHPAMALDLFVVRTTRSTSESIPGKMAPSNSKWDRIRSELDKLVSTPLVPASLRSYVAAKTKSTLPHKVMPAVKTEFVIEPADAGNETIVEIATQDYRGLLCDLALALYEAGLDIRLAKITTEGARALDTFYVSRVGAAEPLSPEESAALIVRLQTLLEVAK